MTLIPHRMALRAFLYGRELEHRLYANDEWIAVTDETSFDIFKEAKRAFRIKSVPSWGILSPATAEPAGDKEVL